MKKLLLVVLLGALALQGYPELMSRARAEVIREEAWVAKPAEAPERWEVISDVPAGHYKKLRLGSASVKPVSQNTIAALQDEAKKTGRIVFVSAQETLISAQSNTGRWFIGWVEPGEVFLAKASKMDSTEIQEYQLEQLGIHKNSVKGVRLRRLTTTLKTEQMARPSPLTRFKPVERQTIAPAETVMLPKVQAEQIIEASLSDAATLLAPTDQILSEQKEEAAKTEQLAKRTEFKKKVRSQKFVDAGVTTAAIGTAFIPVFGPYIAGGIILSRVGWGLFQDDFDEDQ